MQPALDSFKMRELDRVELVRDGGIPAEVVGRGAIIRSDDDFVRDRPKRVERGEYLMPRISRDTADGQRHQMVDRGSICRVVISEALSVARLVMLVSSPTPAASAPGSRAGTTRTRSGCRRRSMSRPTRRGAPRRGRRTRC